MISVLCPSRGRPLALSKSLASLGDRPETLVIVDPDERGIYSSFWPYVAPTRYGYQELHKYYNYLADRAVGEWLLLWNDDAIMETENWVDIVESYEPNQVLNPGGNLPGFCTFPIVPAKWVRRVSHFSLSPHNDTWWEFIGRELDAFVEVPEIYIRHERFDLTGDNNDSTFQERVYRSDDFFSEEMVAAREKDKLHIKPFLRKP